MVLWRPQGQSLGTKTALQSCREPGGGGHGGCPLWRGEGLSTAPPSHIPSMNGPLHRQSEQLTIYILLEGSELRSCGRGGGTTGSGEADHRHVHSSW